MTARAPVFMAAAWRVKQMGIGFGIAHSGTGRDKVVASKKRWRMRGDGARRATFRDTIFSARKNRPLAA